MAQPSLKNTVVLFTGDDTRAASATFQKWVSEFAKKHGEENITQFSNVLLNTPEILALLLTPSLLGGKRLVVLKDFPQKPPKKSEDADAYATFEEKFVSLLPLIPEDIVVFLHSSEYDGRRKGTKALLQSIDVRNFKQETLSIDERLDRTGITISHPDKMYLKERLGNDPERVYRDIQKLALFADGGGVTREDIDMLIHSSLDVEIFEVLNYLAGDQRIAAKKIQLLLDRGHEPLEIMGTFVWYFERLALVGSLLQKHSKEEVMSLLDMKPYAFESTKKALHAFPASRLRHIFSLLVQFDRQLKNGELSFSAEDKEEVKLAFVEMILRF